MLTFCPYGSKLTGLPVKATFQSRYRSLKWFPDYFWFKQFTMYWTMHLGFTLFLYLHVLPPSTSIYHFFSLVLSFHPVITPSVILSTLTISLDTHTKLFRFLQTFLLLLTLSNFVFLKPPSIVVLLCAFLLRCHPLLLAASLRRDGSDCSQGAGRADQRSSASWRCAIHSASHGPTSGTAGCPAQEPHPWRQRQRSPQPH